MAIDFSNPAALGLTQTNTPIGGGRFLGVCPDIKYAPILDLSKGPLAGAPPSLASIFQNRKAAGSSMMAAITGMVDQCKAAAANAGVMYAGNVTNGPPTMSNLGDIGRGGFTELT